MAACFMELAGGKYKLYSYSVMVRSVKMDLNHEVRSWSGLKRKASDFTNWTHKTTNWTH